MTLQGHLRDITDRTTRVALAYVWETLREWSITFCIESLGRYTGLSGPFRVSLRLNFVVAAADKPP